MKYFLLLSVSILFITGCASHQVEPHSSGLVVTEINPNKQTALVKQNLLHLAQVYELSPFIYTKYVRIEPNAVLQSHPVITLNTKNSEHPNKILANFLHEELHWWAAKNQANINTAVAELKKIYPKVPVTKNLHPNTTYLHLIVCHLELKALSLYLGKHEARKTISSLMKKDKLYSWEYYQVLNKDYAIQRIVRKHKLIPPILALEPHKKTTALLRK